MIVNLSELAIGESALLVSLGVISATARQKLFALGLIPGAKLSVTRRAPLGGPLEVCLENGLTIGIRRSEGQHLQVEKAI